MTFGILEIFFFLVIFDVTPITHRLVRIDGRSESEVGDSRKHTSVKLCYCRGRRLK